MPSKRRPGAACDLEEVRPGLFLVHNPALGPLLRGEGDREGDRFRLTTWRGDGLVARLRARAFVVVTLADQIADLPGPPATDPPGATFYRDLAADERLSTFVAEPPGWAPVPLSAESPPRAVLRQGWVLRRRRGRGAADYYRLVGANLVPLPEDAAILYGYAQAAHTGPLSVALAPAPGGRLLPDIPMPTKQRLLLGRLATKGRDGWLVPAESLGLVRGVLARLGIITGA